MSISNSLSSLPIQELVSAPLVASAVAQSQLAQITHDFIKNVGLNDDGITQTISFSYTDSTGTSKTLTVPLLVIINIPSLAVKTVKIDFSLNVKESTTSSVTTNSTFSVDYNGWFINAKFKGNVATENKRTTDRSAKYSFSIEARDDGPPDGLTKMLEILSESVESVDPPETTQ